jgi:hypothetical protein
VRRVIVIGVRRPTVPGSACTSRERCGPMWLGCAPDLAGPGRSLAAGSFSLRPYPRQVSDDDAMYLHILLR